MDIIIASISVGFALFAFACEAIPASGGTNNGGHHHTPPP